MSARWPTTSIAGAALKEELGTTLGRTTYEDGELVLTYRTPWVVTDEGSFHDPGGTLEGERRLLNPYTFELVNPGALVAEEDTEIPVHIATREDLATLEETVAADIAGKQDADTSVSTEELTAALANRVTTSQLNSGLGGKSDTGHSHMTLPSTAQKAALDGTGSPSGSNRYVTEDHPGLGSGADDFQPLDSDLTALAAITPSNDDFIQRKSGVWVARTIAQVKTDLNYTAADVGAAASGHSHTNLPTTNQKAALDGAASPSGSNVLATMADVGGGGGGGSEVGFLPTSILSPVPNFGGLGSANAGQNRLNGTIARCRKSGTLRELFVFPIASSGNIEVSVYDMSLARLYQSGSVACPAASAWGQVGDANLPVTAGTELILGLTADTLGPTFVRASYPHAGLSHLPLSTLWPDAPTARFNFFVTASVAVGSAPATLGPLSDSSFQYVILGRIA